MRRTACAGELRLDAPTTAAAASLLCERRRPHATGGCASSTMAAQPSTAAYQTMEMRMAAAPPSRAPAHEQPQPPKILTGQHRRQNVLSMKMYSGTSGVGAPDKSRVMPSTISVRSRSRGGPWRAHGGRRASLVCRGVPVDHHAPRTACVPPRQSRGVDSSSWRLQLRWCLNYLAALTRVAPAAHGFRSAPRAAPCGPAPPTCGHPRRARSCPPHEKSRSPAPEHRRHHDGERGAHFLR